MSKIGDLTNLIKGSHVLSNNSGDGLRDYHKAKEALTRKRDIYEKLSIVKVSLKNYNVVVTLMDDDKIRVYRPDTNQELFL